MVILLSTSACLEKNARYCDEEVHCEDPRWPYCVLERRQCNPWPDGGPPLSDASSDGLRGGDAADAPAGDADAAPDAPSGADAARDSATPDGTAHDAAADVGQDATAPVDAADGGSASAATVVELTSGGGVGAAGAFRLWLSVGGPQPHGRGSSADYNLSLGPGSGR